MSKKFEAIHQVVQTAIDQKMIYGASYSLIDSKRIESHFEGVQGADELAINLDPSMIYDLGSLTEVIATSSRIFQLLAVREVGLKDPIVKFLPGFSNEKINIGNLLMHTSGLPVAIDNAENMTGLEFMDALYNIETDFEPGEKVQQSPLNTIVLGLILRTIDGSLDRGVQDHVLYPMAMTNTGYNLNRPKIRFVPTRKDARRGQIQGQVEDPLALILNGESGHAGLFSTLNDLTVFTEMLINRGNYQGKEVLDPQIFDVLGKLEKDGQTLGWQRYNQDTLYATSSTALIVFNTSLKRGLVVLTNYITDKEQGLKLVDDLLKIITE
ncbi:serine hydrolase [Pediococcus argentinicus]|uniref:serine hydrolase domain-containing protein n=1 Tax=Pediococcus argentinicus TaxID=480391 RepID=UPI00338DDE54